MPHPPAKPAITPARSIALPVSWHPRIISDTAETPGNADTLHSLPDRLPTFRDARCSPASGHPPQQSGKTGEVGKQFDVTRERIRQIEAKALRKLRHPSRSEQLRSFLDVD